MSTPCIHISLPTSHRVVGWGHVYSLSVQLVINDTRKNSEVFKELHIVVRDPKNWTLKAFTSLDARKEICFSAKHRNHQEISRSPSRIQRILTDRYLISLCHERNFSFCEICTVFVKEPVVLVSGLKN